MLPICSPFLQDSPFLRPPEGATTPRASNLGSSHGRPHTRVPSITELTTGASAPPSIAGGSSGAPSRHTSDVNAQVAALMGTEGAAELLAAAAAVSAVPTVPAPSPRAGARSLARTSVSGAAGGGMAGPQGPSLAPKPRPAKRFAHVKVNRAHCRVTYQGYPM
jgi:hypothetical protein